MRRGGEQEEKRKKKKKKEKKKRERERESDRERSGTSSRYSRRASQPRLPWPLGQIQNACCLVLRVAIGADGASAS